MENEGVHVCVHACDEAEGEGGGLITQRSAQKKRGDKGGNTEYVRKIPPHPSSPPLSKKGTDI